MTRSPAPRPRVSTRTGQVRPGPYGLRPPGIRSATFLDLEDLVGHQPVRLAVHGRGRFRRGRVDEAEDPALLLVDPVPQVADVVFPLLLQVGLVCLGDVVHLDAVGDVVYVHVQGHTVSLVVVGAPTVWRGPGYPDQEPLPMLCAALPTLRGAAA